MQGYRALCARQYLAARDRACAAACRACEGGADLVLSGCSDQPSVEAAYAPGFDMLQVLTQMNGAASTHGEALKTCSRNARIAIPSFNVAEVLRARRQVRCGRCGEISMHCAFAEDAPPSTTVESAFEMEERADSILESVVAEQAMQPRRRGGGCGGVRQHRDRAAPVLDFTERI